MSKSLIKLLDNSIFPASIMILGKLVGVALTISIFQIPFTIKEYANTIFSVRAVVRAEDIQTVTSYSDLLMFAFLAIFFSITLFRAVYLHNSHVKPTLVSRLANSNLLKLIQSSYEIYHSAAIWLLFMWVSNIIVIVNAVNQNTFMWIAVVTSLLSVLLTTILLQDVYKEIEHIKTKPGDYNWG